MMMTNKGDRKEEKMRYEISEKNILTVYIIGHLNTVTIPHLCDQIYRYFKSRGNVIEVHLDCTNLEYISSAGTEYLNSLIDKIAGKNCKIIFENPSESVRKVLEAMDISAEVSIIPEIIDEDIFNENYGDSKYIFWR